ncbi:MAG: M81 family metallopeptidase [Burkholderiales bacterium]
MHVVAAMFKHETNTFSPVPTPLSRFARGGTVPNYGEKAIEAFRGTGTSFAAFLDLAQKHGATVSTPVAAHAWPSGPVDDDAFEEIAGRICKDVAAGCDAVLLELHGAMVTRSFDDAEGELLARIRAIAPDVPIGVSLDMHANISQRMVSHCTAIAGYQTYPHIDFYETGTRAAAPVFALLEGRARPVQAFGQSPMLPHVMRQASTRMPNQALQARCREMEREGALAASLFTGFPHADVPDAGLSVVVVTDDDPALAQRFRDELIERAWDAREQFVFAIEPLAQSIARATATAEGPVILLDHYDNAASGGTMDTVTVLGAILDAGLADVAAFAVCDPAAVQQMIASGIGSTVTVSLGGKLDMPSIGVRGEPRTVTGRVRVVSDGRYRNEGPALKGVQMDMGPTVVLDTGNVEIVVVSKQQEPNDLACLKSVGIDPARKRFLMLKSRVHYGAGFAGLAKAVIECAGTGVCTSDYGALKFEKVRRPIFPLDQAW